MRRILVAAALCAAGGAQAALEARDLDLNVPGFEGVFDGSKTWFANPLASGRVNYFDGLAFAADLDVGGYTGWRMIGFADGLHAMYDEWKTAMQLKHYFGMDVDTDVGVASPLFHPLPEGNFWMNGTLTPPNPFSSATYVYWDTWESSSWGGFMTHADGADAVAWAVHDGDIGVPAPIPEPTTYALLAAGLVLMIARRHCSKAPRSGAAPVGRAVPTMSDHTWTVAPALFA